MTWAFIPFRATSMPLPLPLLTPLPPYVPFSRPALSRLIRGFSTRFHPLAFSSVPSTCSVVYLYVFTLCVFFCLSASYSRPTCTHPFSFISHTSWHTTTFEARLCHRITKRRLSRSRRTVSTIPRRMNRPVRILVITPSVAFIIVLFTISWIQSHYFLHYFPFLRFYFTCFSHPFQLVLLAFVGDI